MGFKFLPKRENHIWLFWFLTKNKRHSGGLSVQLKDEMGWVLGSSSNMAFNREIDTLSWGFLLV